MKIKFSSNLNRNFGGVEKTEASRHFYTPGDLDGEKHFYAPGDLEDKSVVEKNINPDSLSVDEIKEYLLTIVSGKRYDSVCELGVLMGSGRIIVDFKRLQEMVAEGHNIVSAQCLSPDGKLIEVEFQKYEYNEELMERRRRF